MSSEKTSRFQQWTKIASNRLMVMVLGIMVIGSVAANVLMWRESRSATNEEAGRVENSEAADPNSVTLDIAAQRNIGLALEAAQIKTIVQTIQTTGSVGPNETRVAHIRPLARGRIEKVHVRMGDRVRAGQPLVEYDNIELGELIGGLM